jgi:hypothetical protein
VVASWSKHLAKSDPANYMIIPKHEIYVVGYPSIHEHGFGKAHLSNGNGPSDTIMAKAWIIFTVVATSRY